VRSQNGYLPIHYAADAGNWALVKLLIEQDFKEINSLGSDGFTALGYVERKLKKKGARTQKGNKYALLEKTARVLLEKGAIRRAHVDVPIEENTQDILYMRNNQDGTYQMKATTDEEVLRILRMRFFPSKESMTFTVSDEIDRKLLGERRSVLCLIEGEPKHY